jgi:hypothetical protein
LFEGFVVNSTNDIRTFIMAEKRNISWRAPVLIIAAFLTACALAVAHHEFNRSLAGTPVTSQEYHVGDLHYT